ncbi:ribonuclease III domain-containing protein [Petroclostridium sp. X23]|jgi:ribonuclease-3 family protein|uniref:Mini-ribonuclease 3 n=1 Tax=Petroclostridium sp. X23 TaxID=3045146 RepID=UPI0024AE1287|nr:ribonuclease III domain-containing protein [Petroclostridium sp. X23]WHH61398.1 ribonuclease III domain-containing protein [Petroclostridium sp. X23]
MFDEFINQQAGLIKKEHGINPSQYSPLVLAYIGDAVYEVYIRTMLIKKGNMPVHKLHRQATLYVKAKAQSDTIHRIEGYLTGEELAVFKRGRNAKSGTVPKNADINDYRHATGFEALLGYLYLSNNTERLMEILTMSLGNVDDGNNNK